MIRSEFEHTSITVAQALALHKVYSRNPLYAQSATNVVVSATPSYEGQEPITFEVFLGLIEVSDCIMVPWCGMWLGIEKDGYTHS